MLDPDAPNGALLSILGVPGWGPLHLLLKRRANPAQVAGRLRQSLRQAGLPLSGSDVRGGRLLTALLRSQADLDPVAAIADGSALAGLRYRHRLVCRPAGALDIRSWERSGRGDSWCALGPARRLEAFLRWPQPGTAAVPSAALVRRPRHGRETMGSSPFDSWRPKTRIS